jgi:hypothetical protein
MPERIMQDNDEHEHNECLQYVMPHDQLLVRSLLQIFIFGSHNAHILW